MKPGKTNNKQRRRKISLLVLLVGIFAFLLAVILFFWAARDAGMKAIGPPVKEGVQFVETAVEASLSATHDSDLLILVNKNHSVDQNYVPQQLIPLKHVAENRDEQYQRMIPDAAAAFEALAQGAEASGYDIVCTTAYRPYDYQKQLYDGYVSGKGQSYADRYSARPGESEHQTGLAVDVSSSSVNYQLKLNFGETAEGKWLAEHCAEYGFILRYRKDKEDITGYNYEPWHIRYVGKAAAEEITQKEITLEEYLGSD